MFVESPPMYTHEGTIVTFWEDALPNDFASTKSGKAEFDRVLMMKVTSPGSKDTNEFEIEREYPKGFPHPVHKERRVNKPFYQKYKKYIDEFKANGSKVVTEGTPIEQWAMIDARRAKTYAFHGIHTVEALATLTDSAIAAVGMGTREMVQKAKDWLEQAKNSAAAMQAQDMARRTQEQLDHMRLQMTDLAEALNSLPPEAKAHVQDELKKRGKAKAA